MQTFYVHKLRLEANDGALVDIKSVAVRSQQGGWIAAKSVAAVILAAAVLATLASALV